MQQFSLLLSHVPTKTTGHTCMNLPPSSVAQQKNKSCNLRVQQADHT
uniref:Uncharacterized protein n=1 Tax=Arundo donax TaxID=35708 RepID=A0A0A9H2G4_ARUDO